MASRVTIYGKNQDTDVKRLKREMNTMYVEYALVDPLTDDRAQRHIQNSVEEPIRFPLVEVTTQYGDGSVFMTNPDEPTLRQCLLSEEVLSETAYWL